MAAHIDRAWVTREISNFNRELITLPQLVDNIIFHFGVRKSFDTKMKELLSQSLAGEINPSTDKLEVSAQRISNFVRSILNSKIHLAKAESLVQQALKSSKSRLLS